MEPHAQSGLRRDGLTAQDVIGIIKEAKRAGITSFSLGELQFSFEGNPKVKKRIGKENSEFQRQNLEQEELRLKQEQLDHLRIADPEAYEQMIAEDDMV